MKRRASERGTGGACEGHDMSVGVHGMPNANSRIATAGTPLGMLRNTPRSPPPAQKQHLKQTPRISST